MAALQYADAATRRGPRPRPDADRRLRPVPVHGHGHGAAPVAGGMRPGLAVLAVLLLLVAGPVLTGEEVGGGAGTGATTSPGGTAAVVATTPTAGAVHVVQPRETYWAIAQAIRGDGAGDLRPVVDALAAANGSRPLHAGDRLVLPAPEDVAGRQGPASAAPGRPVPLPPPGQART